MTFFNNCNPINRLLCFFNPTIPLSNTHYTCGFNLAIFSSIAQVENCLTGVTDTCKQLTSCSKKQFLEGKNRTNNIDENTNKKP